MDCLLNICRTCLTEQGEFQSVFISEESSGLNIHLAEMLMACASIQVTFGDGLPEQICKGCADKTVSMFLFKIKCEESDSRLRNQLGKSPLKDDYASLPFDNISDANVIEKSPSCSLPDIDVINDDELSSHNVELDTKPQLFGDESEELSRTQESDETNKVNFYKCMLCPKVYNRSSNLIRHEKFHLNDQMFKCELCDKKFTREDLLERHKLAHAKKNNQELDRHTSDLKDSTKELSSESDDQNESNTTKEKILFEETKEIKKEEPLDIEGEDLTCRICKKKFVKVSRLKRHLKTHSAVKPFTCQICFRGFARQELFKNHMNTHSGNKPHVCSICKKGFNQISNLKDHMRTHNGEKPFLCSTCGKGFNQLGNLRQHTIRHSGVKAHICSMCGNGFASKGELSAHLRKHTGARPFVCSICQHGFTTSSSLTKHKRIHSGEKPYECDVCHMKFSRNGILSRHKRIHTGEKPYVCNYCCKAFTQSNDLNSHLRIHTGEKPFICDQCGQAFRQSSALKTHKRTHIEFKPFSNSDNEGKSSVQTKEERKAFLEARFDFETNTWTYIKKIEQNV